jgi:phosphoribosylanthranilate isomerase
MLLLKLIVMELGYLFPGAKEKNSVPNSKICVLDRIRDFCCMVPEIKICGLREAFNAAQVLDLKPDALGFIFYSKSARLAEAGTVATITSSMPVNVARVGVFVNESISEMLKIADMAGLDTIQLHGDENPETAAAIHQAGLKVWKAISVGEQAPDWGKIGRYNPFVDSFLFDTATAGFGGSGKTFQHRFLENYPYEIPFWLSGGIGPEFRSLPSFLRRLPFRGFDLNSRFEVGPGQKDPKLLADFITFWTSEFNGNQYV